MVGGKLWARRGALSRVCALCPGPSAPPCPAAPLPPQRRVSLIQNLPLFTGYLGTEGITASQANSCTSQTLCHGKQRAERAQCYRGLQNRSGASSALPILSGDRSYTFHLPSSPRTCPSHWSSWAAPSPPQARVGPDRTVPSSSHETFSQVGPW